MNSGVRGGPGGMKLLEHSTVFTRIQENYARLEVRLSGGKTEQP